MVVALTIQISNSPAGQCAPAQLSERFFIQVGNMKRAYRLRLPSAYNGSTPFPLILVFHGRSQGAKDIEEVAQFSRAADEQGFILVYPIGIHEHWNDGRNVVPILGAKNYDDVGFIKTLITYLRTTLVVDPNRIYATGMSNGGMFVQRLACELDGTFAAIGPVSGTLPKDIVQGCTPNEPVSVIEFHGTRDAYIHWDGGSVRALGGNTLSVQQTIAHWRQRDGCPSDIAIDYVPTHDFEDPTRVRRERYGSCRENSEVVLYTVEGGGHVWPGGPSDISLPFLGRVTRQISATETIVSFFAQHPKFVQAPVGKSPPGGRTGPTRIPARMPHPSQPRMTPPPTSVPEPSFELKTSPLVRLLRFSLSFPLGVPESLNDFAFGGSSGSRQVGDER